MLTVQLAGHLGRDPETRFTPSGQKVTTFSVAVNQRKGKEDVTIWVRVTIWGDRFDKMLPFFKKGSAVIVCGKLNPPTTYVDKEGRTQVSIEVTAEMLEFSPFGKPSSTEGQQQNNNQTPYAAPTHDYTQQVHEEPAFQSSGRVPYNNHVMTGQASSSSSHADEDIPF